MMIGSGVSSRISVCRRDVRLELHGRHVGLRCRRCRGTRSGVAGLCSSGLLLARHCVTTYVLQKMSSRAVSEGPHVEGGQAYPIHNSHPRRHRRRLRHRLAQNAALDVNRTDRAPRAPGGGSRTQTAPTHADDRAGEDRLLRADPVREQCPPADSRSAARPGRPCCRTPSPVRAVARRRPSAGSCSPMPICSIIPAPTIGSTRPRSRASARTRTRSARCSSPSVAATITLPEADHRMARREVERRRPARRRRTRSSGCRACAGRRAARCRRDDRHQHRVRHPHHADERTSSSSARTGANPATYFEPVAQLFEHARADAARGARATAHRQQRGDHGEVRDRVDARSTILRRPRR